MIQVISIILEAIIAILAVFIAINKKKVYGFGFALTFLIYVFYDSISLFGLSVNNVLMGWLFFIATLSAGISMGNLYWYLTRKKN